MNQLEPFGRNLLNVCRNLLNICRKPGSETRIPLPICVQREHKSVFHLLFDELRATRLRNLCFTQAGLFLSLPDLMCLGHALRTASHLQSVDIQGLDKVTLSGVGWNCTRFRLLSKMNQWWLIITGEWCAKVFCFRGGWFSSVHFYDYNNPTATTTVVLFQYNDSLIPHNIKPHQNMGLSLMGPILKKM